MKDLWFKHKYLETEFDIHIRFDPDNPEGHVNEFMYIDEPGIYLNLKNFHLNGFRGDLIQVNAFIHDDCLKSINEAINAHIKTYYEYVKHEQHR